jgi:hypothetical protein
MARPLEYRPRFFAPKQLRTTTPAARAWAGRYPPPPRGVAGEGASRRLYWCAVRKVIVIQVAVMTCEKLMRNSRTALPCNIIAQLVLLGLNAVQVQVVGSNPAISVIVIKVVVMAKQTERAQKLVSLLSHFFTHADTCI